MKPIRTHNRRFAIIVAVVLIAFSVSHGQERARMFTALNAEATNCLTRIQSELALLGDRFPVLKDITIEEIKGACSPNDDSFMSRLTYERDVNIYKPGVAGPLLPMAEIHKPNTGGIILKITISTSAVKAARTKYWEVPLERQKKPGMTYEKITVLYDVNTGEAARPVADEFKPIVEKHLVEYYEKAKKLVGEVR